MMATPHNLPYENEEALDNLYIHYAMKLGRHQILIVGNDGRGPGRKYCVIDELRNSITNPIAFPRDVYQNRMGSTINQRTRTLYVFNLYRYTASGAYFASYNLDTGIMRILSREDIDKRIRSPIICVNGTLYKFCISSTGTKGITRKLAHLKWDPLSRTFHSISTVPITHMDLEGDFIAVPSQDLLLRISIEEYAWSTSGIVVQRLWLTTGRRDKLYFDCTSCAQIEELKYIDFLKSPVLTANESYIMVMAHSRKGRYPEEHSWQNVLIFDISNPNHYHLYQSTFTVDLGPRGHGGDYSFSGTFGGGVLAAGYIRKQSENQFPVAIVGLVQRFLNPEHIHLITFPYGLSGETKGVHSKIAVDVVLKNKIKLMDQSAVIEIEHEIIAQPQQRIQKRIRRHSV